MTTWTNRRSQRSRVVVCALSSEVLALVAAQWRVPKVRRDSSIRPYLFYVVLDAHHDGLEREGIIARRGKAAQ